MQSLLGQVPELAAAKASAAERFETAAVGPLDRAEHVGAIPRSTNRDQKVAGLGKVLELLDENAVKPFVISPRENVRRVVGEADDAQAFLAVILKIFAAQRSFAQVLAKMG